MIRDGKFIYAGIDKEKRDAVWAIDISKIPPSVSLEDILAELDKGNIPEDAITQIYPDDINKTTINQ